jgi:hypothetical protein
MIRYLDWFDLNSSLEYFRIVFPYS